MKNKIFILSFIMAGFITFCAKNTITNPENPGQILVKPSILFTKDNKQVSPDSVDRLVFTITYQNKTIVETFDFEDHTGTLSKRIPVNISFKLRIEGIDNNGKVIYYGEQEFSGASKDTTIRITAAQVTPCAPENLTAHALDSLRVSLKWEDKSSNEMGFIIKRSEYIDSLFTTIATVDKDQEEKIDYTGIIPNTVYYYKMMAYNAAGNSYPVDAKYDPVEVVPTPIKPYGDAIVIAGLDYFFSTDSISCGNGHLLQYRFSWGDQDTSSWSYSQTAVHSWLNKETYIINVQARCSVNPYVISNWSEGLTITVSGKKL